MNRDATRKYLRSRPEAWEDHPFGPEFAVYKIGKHMIDRAFALVVRKLLRAERVALEVRHRGDAIDR